MFTIEEIEARDPHRYLDGRLDEALEEATRMMLQSEAQVAVGNIRKATARQARIARLIERTQSSQVLFTMALIIDDKSHYTQAHDVFVQLTADLREFFEAFELTGETEGELSEWAAVGKALAEMEDLTDAVEFYIHECDMLDGTGTDAAESAEVQS